MRLWTFWSVLLSGDEGGAEQEIVCFYSDRLNTETCKPHMPPLFLRLACREAVRVRAENPRRKLDTRWPQPRKQQRFPPSRTEKTQFLRYKVQDGDIMFGGFCTWRFRMHARLCVPVDELCSVLSGLRVCDWSAQVPPIKL